MLWPVVPVAAWVMGTVGAPAFMLGFLVPIRESGSLIPQLVIARALLKCSALSSPFYIALAPVISNAGVIAVLALVGLAGAALSSRLPEVQQ